MIKELTNEQREMYDAFVDSKETIKAFSERTGIKYYSIYHIVRKKKTLDTIHNMDTLTESFIPLIETQGTNNSDDEYNKQIKCKVNGFEVEMSIQDLKELLK